ncbi:unnamed protein product [Periconia digitata]|uniref:Uncharacterized protein n=1 Tax=Periconia digitata TaxID=1303443 RepID=A0A9W4UJV3_9PLEO|nr:unnamed protein product [Periconia digitata]
MKRQRSQSPSPADRSTKRARTMDQEGRENQPLQQLQLFPALPAELRNILYGATLSNPPTNKNLPFQRKTYTSSHTTVHLIPTYHGLPSLISLQNQNFREAHEYRSHVLNSSAVSLKISVHFKGNTQTFNQAHWDEKHIAHLQTLLKKYSWLSNVRDYDVQILWEPLTIGRRVKPKVQAGVVANRMVDVLTTTLRGGVEPKRRDAGVIQAGLHIAAYAAMESIHSGSRLELSEYLWASPSRAPAATTTISHGTGKNKKAKKDRYTISPPPPALSPYIATAKAAPAATTTTPSPSCPQTHVREVRISPHHITSPTPTPWLPKGFKPIPNPSPRGVSETPLLVESHDGYVEWTPWLQGHLVYARTTKERKLIEEKRGAAEPLFKEKWKDLPAVLYPGLVCECKQADG